MAQRSLEKMHPFIEGGEKYGFQRITFIPSDTRKDDPVAGSVEYDESASTLYVYDGSSWSALGPAETASTGLDGAYDLNPTITVDGVTLTLAGENVDVLTITQSANDENLVLTKTGTGSGSVIKINNSGTGDDIQGTSDTWAVTAAGAATFTSLDGVGNITVEDITATSSSVSITTDATSGVAVAIEADTLNSGTALEIDSDTGAAVTLLDLQNDGTSAFTVDGTGVLTIAGSAKDTDAIVITDGDITLTDGDLDLASGQVSIISDGAGDGVTIKDITGAVNYDLLYLNGFTNSGSGSILKIDQGAATRTGHMVDLNMGTTAVAMSAIDITCTGGTRTVPIIAMDSDGTASDFIYCHTDGIFTGNMINLNAATGAASGNFIFIDNDTGTSMEAIKIDDEANVEDIILVDSAGAIGAANAQIHLIQSAGTVNATANAILVDWTADVDANTPYMVKLDSHGRDIGAMIIDSDAATDDVISITNGGALANDKAVIDVVWNGTPANAGANMLRLDATGVTADNKPVLMEILGSDKTVKALEIDADITDKDVVSINGGGALTNGNAVLALTNDGNLATGGNVFSIDVGGTPHAAAIAAEITAAKDCQALVISTAAETDSAVEIIGSGAVANNKALLELNWTSEPANAGSNMLRVDGSGGTNTVKPTLVEIYDDSVSVGLSVSTASIEDMVVLTGTGNTDAGYAVLAVTSTGTIVDGAYYVDVTSGAAGASSTASYLMHLDATHANIGALHVDAGKVLFDETLEVTGATTLTGAVTASSTITATTGVQCASVARTATDGGDGDAVIADGTSVVTVDADSDADHILTLPTPTPGNIVYIIEDGSTGYELATDTPTSVYLNGAKGTAYESAIAGAITYVKCVCVDATHWICNQYDADGDETKVEAANDS